jgi:uncharacterized protein YjbJ (UPF0337 family)
MGETIDKAKGKLKQAVADLTGDKELKREGQDDERKGKAEGVVNDVKHAVADVKHAIKGAVK